MDWAILAFFGLYTLAVFWLGWWSCAYRWTSQGTMAAHTGKRCDYNGCYRALPKDALRTHDGHWRCAEHKAG